MKDSSKHCIHIIDSSDYSSLYRNKGDRVDNFSAFLGETDEERDERQRIVEKSMELDKSSRWRCLQEQDDDYDDIYDKSDSRCYLTSACMKYLREKFDDNCYELTVLRWFRDNFVSQNDIEHYYNVAPTIVARINDEDRSNTIYDYIYDSIIDYCVTEIENGNYEEAYRRYKESILALETHYIGQSDMNAISKKSRKLVNSHV